MTLSSNNAALTVPASVTVAAGATTGTFTATAGSVSATQSVTVTATLNGSATTVVTVTPPAPAVTTLQASPTSVASGGTSTLTVTLSTAAPTGGSIVTLSSNNAALTVPASVTVAAGSTTGTFTATAGSVSATQSVTVTATLNGTATTVVTVTPPAPPGGTTYFGNSNLTGMTSIQQNTANTTKGSASTQGGSFTAPVGTPRINEISLYAAKVGKGGTSILMAVYDNAKNGAGPLNLVCEGIAKVPVNNTTYGWVGHVGSSSLTGPCTLTPGAMYNIYLTYDNAGGQGTMGYYYSSPSSGTNNNYNTLNNSGGWPSTIVVPNNPSNYDFAWRVGIDSTTIGPAVSTLQASPTSVASGGTSTLTVTLSTAAPTGGSIVTLSSNNAALTVPASVTVAAGSTTGTFTATAGSVGANQQVTVTATLNGSATTVVTVTPPPPKVTTLQASPTSVASGGTSTLTVTLSTAAPTGGSVVTLSSNNAALTVPASVTVAAGATTGTFTATAGSVGATQSVTVTATLNGTATTVVTVTPPAPKISTLQASPTSVASGGTSTLTVTLSTAAPTGGSIVTLSSNNAALTVPASVTVAAGATTGTFTATAGSVSATQSVTVTATLNGTATTVVTVTPSGGSGSPAVTTLQASPMSVASGGTSTLTVTLSVAAPTGGSVVTLSSNNAALTVPASVTVAAGSTTGTFTATAGSVSATQQVTVTATLNGTATTVVTVTPPTVFALQASPTSVVSGSASTCSVTLSGPAPTGGSVVTLSSNNAALTVPASVTVAAGATTGTFTATAGSVSANQQVTVTATLNGTATAGITVTPLAATVSGAPAITTTDAFVNIEVTAYDGRQYLYGYDYLDDQTVLRIDASTYPTTVAYTAMGKITDNGVMPAGSTIWRIYSSTLNAGYVYILACDTSYNYFLLRSTDYGATMTKVFTFGNGNGPGGTQAINVLILDGWLEVTHAYPGGGGLGDIIIGEYNTNSSRPVGSTNDRVRVVRSTDGGATWTTLMNWNTNGTNQVGHVHTLSQDPYTGYLYFGTGDETNKAAILRWDGASPWTDNTTMPNFATLPGFKVATGAQRYRTVGILYSANYIHTFSDTTADPANAPDYDPSCTEAGIWRWTKDLSSGQRMSSDICTWDNYHIGWRGLTMGNNLIFTTSAEDKEGSGPNLQFYTSNNEGATWVPTGEVTLQARSPAKYLNNLAQWGNNILVDVTGLAGFNGTAIVQWTGSSFSDVRPERLWPVWWIGPSGVDDSSHGYTARKPWATPGYALTNNLITYGAHVKLLAGTYTGAAWPLWNAYAIDPAFIGNGPVVIEGAGASSTTWTSSSGGYLLYLEADRVGTSAAFPLVFKNMKMSNTYSGGSGNGPIYAGIGTGGPVYTEWYNMTLGDTTESDDNMMKLPSTHVMKAVRTTFTHRAYPAPATYGMMIYPSANASFAAQDCLFLNSRSAIQVNATGVSLSILNSDFVGFGYAGIFTSVAAGSLNVTDNIYYSTISGAQSYHDDSGTIETGVDYNIYYNTNSGLTDGGHSLPVGTSPLFVNGASDFHLQTTSPACHAGTSTGIFYDYDGIAITGSPTIGAYQENCPSQ